MVIHLTPQAFTSCDREQDVSIPSGAGPARQGVILPSARREITTPGEPAAT
jgi:hypothetical protein